MTRILMPSSVFSGALIARQSASADKLPRVRRRSRDGRNEDPMQANKPGRPKSRVAEIALPVPPSVNNAWVNVPGKGRVRSAAYRAWREEAGWLIKAARLETLTGYISVAIRAGMSDRSRDLDNIIKPLLDALTAFGVIEDDAKVARIVTEWSAEVPSARVAIEVRQSVGPQSRHRYALMQRLRWGSRALSQASVTA